MFYGAIYFCIAPFHFIFGRDELRKMFFEIDIDEIIILIISIRKFGFSDFRNSSFSISDFSFVYAYTKEKSEMLKE